MWYGYGGRTQQISAVRHLQQLNNSRLNKVLKWMKYKCNYILNKCYNLQKSLPWFKESTEKVLWCLIEIFRIRTARRAQVHAANLGFLREETETITLKSSIRSWIKLLRERNLITALKTMIYSLNLHHSISQNVFLMLKLTHQPNLTA